MSPDSLQSLSVAAVFVGVFLTTLGGFGAFHFGQKADRALERERTQAMEAITTSVASLELEQRGLRAWISSVEKTVTTSPAQAAHTLAASTVTATPPQPPIEPPLPPVAEGPAEIAKMEPLDTALNPLKLPLPDQPPVSIPEPPEVPAPAKPTVGKGFSLGAQQRALLIKRLRAHPHQGLAIQAVEGDPQALDLATALQAAFREAGWRVSGVETVLIPSATPGLLLSTGVFPPREEFIAAYSALERAGFIVTSDLDPNQSGHRVVLSVGPKR